MTSKPLKTVEELLTAVFNEGMAYQVASMKEFQDMNFLSVYEAKSEIYQLMLSLVGEDEYPDAHFSTYLSGKEIERYDRVTARDRLRAELRAKLSEHFNVEGEQL